MWYWYLSYKNLEKTDSLRQALIAEYVYRTGIQSSSREDLIRAFETKDVVNDSCLDDLDRALAEGKKKDKKTKFWKGVAICEIPVVFGLGVVSVVVLRNL